uniref:Uncharacterized protein n=1 Tax=Rhizophora mucronata TaxID=61149 RepID=A0A2P2QWX2_RHIMU
MKGSVPNLPIAL